MEKKELFTLLKKKNPATLLTLLESAYDIINTTQRRNVFGKFKAEMPKAKVDPAKLLQQIKTFYDESLKGVYYAPFDINSKNYMNIPEETEEWFDKAGDFLKAATQVSNDGNHQLAVECFDILYQLIDKMIDGDEIIFADEYGTWMIPGDEKVFIKAYIQSLSEVSSPEEFSEAVIPLLMRDSYESFSNSVYKLATQAANKEQKRQLQAAIKEKKIRVKK